MINYELNLTDDIESEEDSSLSAANLLDGVGVTDADWTVETVLSQVSKGNIILNPRFQRRETWDDKRKSRFIESLILGLPIPQLVLAEVKGSRGKFIVIDGKQRLLALQRFASITSSPLTLKSLEIRKDLNSKTWHDIQNDPAFADDVRAFENAQIRTTMVKGWTDEKALYLIFHRLNSGSVPLSPQELRHVLHPGKFIDFAFDYTESNNIIISILGHKGQPDFRMRDVELLIRAVGFQYFLNNYNGDLKDFLDNTVKKLNEYWEDKSEDIIKTADNCAKAIQATVEIFGFQDSFSKWSKNSFERRFNRAVFDIMTYYFCDIDTRELAIASIESKALVKANFIELCNNNAQFIKSIESTTKTTEAVIARLWLWGKSLENAIGRRINQCEALEKTAKTYGII